MSRFAGNAASSCGIIRALGMLIAMDVALSPVRAQMIRVKARNSATNASLSNVLLGVLRENGDVVLSAMTSREGVRLIQISPALRHETSCQSLRDYK